MLSVASLLNPAPSGPSRHRLPPSPATSSPTNSFADETAFLERSIMPKQKVAKDAAVFTKGKPKGTVNFQPHERLDESSLREARKYQVFPSGRYRTIADTSHTTVVKRTSSRKLAGKALKYVFKLPGDDTEYVVMWDYNVGLVRMTPFFKCCKYSKTTPAKMLNMNPGLKEITHSITGGSIMAQGYWMPFNCAKAVCATFCYRISGALIPIFGPDFPSMCIPPDAPEHGRMIIDPTIILQSTRETDRFRRLYSNMVTSASGGASPNRVLRRPARLGGYDDARPEYPRLRVRRPFFSSENPYGIDTDGEVSPATDRGLHERFLYSPIQVLTPLRPPTSSWTPVNNPHPHHHHYDAVPPPHNHWLSAVPRLGSPQPYHHTAPPPMHAPNPAIYHHHHHHSQIPHMTPSSALSVNRQQSPQRDSPRKRSAEHLEHGYSEVIRVESGGRREVTSLQSPAAFTPPLKEEKKPTTTEAADLGPEKKAALLLMNLSVRDTVARSNGRPGGVASASTSPTDVAFPRKRQRASSM
ncbi:DNA-binding of Mlu1-box binding protein MBP1 [Apiospora phragmitis]|uniref:DNA-binding of Mlu1-box binding protein MBP1 n=1 Tax=Apiospora phragmitis TaxID=2905665 RepID=A0ABR1T7T4_9PEZI